MKREQREEENVSIIIYRLKPSQISQREGQRRPGRSPVHDGSGQIDNAADDGIPFPNHRKRFIHVGKGERGGKRNTHVKKACQSSSVLRSLSSSVLQSATASSGFRLDIPSARDASLPANSAYDPPGPYVSRFRDTSNTVPAWGAMPCQ